MSRLPRPPRSSRSRSTRLRAAAGTALAALALGVAAPPAGAAPPHSSAGPHVMGLHRHAGGRQQSLNWAGYLRTGKGFTTATATWTVPTVSTTPSGYSSTWVGIDGAASGDRYLIQTGTEADAVGGRRSYAAWWEVITPSDVAPENRFALSIHPGDTITASVTRTAPGRWTMQLRDVTSGHSASHSAAFAGPGSSIEWIQEDTDVDGYISAAPNWHSVTFRGLTLNGRRPALKASEALDLVDAHGTREAAAGPPNHTGDGFTVSWLAAGTRSRAGG